MAPLLFVFFLLLMTQTKTKSICDKPLNLNTAPISELVKLPYITKTNAELIVDIRPICSPLELAAVPKQIKGINERRLNNNWDWFKGKRCSTTCCKAYAVCPLTIDSDSYHDHMRESVVFWWKAGDWDVCTTKCGKGTQHRAIKCYDYDSKVVDDKYCITLVDDKPLSKRVCNVDPCPSYEWKPDKWDECTPETETETDTDINCSQQRTIKCYDTSNNELSADSKCDHKKRAHSKQKCECKVPKYAYDHRSLLWIDDKGIKVGGDVVAVDLLNEFNSKQCNTEMYRNIDDKEKILITRRACTIYIYVHISGDGAAIDSDSKIDVSWFRLDATLQANINEVDSVWNGEYLSWHDYKHEGDVTMGWLGIALPNNANIGKFLCDLYYRKMKVAAFTVFVLFNPYNADDAVSMNSLIDRNEYIENEFGLIWVGNADDNSAMKWKYDQFHFPNLEIAMNLLNRLTLKYRNNIVLISRQISYAVQEDICYGKWGQGPYTSGPAPNGGYQCHGSKKNCIEPWSWTGTTQLFDLYRDVLKYEYKAQYCQCFIYAAVSTTVGRALGIPTRPTSNFQSAHDTDFNRAIESYWIFNRDSRTYSKTKGESSDSVWNFHVWNEMYFERKDFLLPKYNTKGWQAIDATPQELSCGGNPSLSEGGCAYQMGPAAISLIRENINTHKCKDAAAELDKQRFGCFDTEFVISETNANYNFWSKSSDDDGKYAKFTLSDSFLVDPWDNKWGTIGVLTNTKKPDVHISADCLNEAIRDCDDDYLDLTLFYKKKEPSDPGMPTDKRHRYKKGDKRHRRRLLWAQTNYTFDDLEDTGIEYNILTVPDKENRSPMIVADNPSDIINLYKNDYTFGMIALNIDSFEDNELDIYCSVIATAHDYSGQQFGQTIKNKVFKFKLAAGQSTDLCQLYLYYNDYLSWIHTNFRVYDSSEIAYIFRFTVTASIYDTKMSDTQALDIVIEQRDILVCWPIFKLRDRIICTHQLDWFKPKYAEYKCDDNHNDNVGDGFCDDINNYEGCYDGGDCCKSTCIVSKNYKCPYFNCMDPRIQKRNENFEKCPNISSFINYINNLTESGVCDDNVFMDECPNTNTENQCIDHILAITDLFNDDIESCYSAAIYSVNQTVIKPIMEFIIECMQQQQVNTIGDGYESAHNDINDNYMDLYNYFNSDNYFKSLQYELISIGIVLVLLVLFIVLFICFVFGGLVGVYFNKSTT